MYPELLEKGFLEQHSRLSSSELHSVGLEYTSSKLSSVLHGGDLWYRGAHQETTKRAQQGRRATTVALRWHLFFAFSARGGPCCRRGCWCRAGRALPLPPSGPHQLVRPPAGAGAVAW